ncbi:MAG: ethanolamine utilization protein EutN [Ignavibacteria bacterium]|nr:ethanolamine utilization protein EutN [Ignavibacteria bacterium]
MVLCKITGTIVSTHKDEHFKEQKLLIAQPIDTSGKFIGKEILSVDTVDAGVGDVVLVMQEGSGARQILKDDKIPVHSVIVAVVDGIDVKE